MNQHAELTLSHPEKYYLWTEDEKKAILKYGDERAAAALAGLPVDCRTCDYSYYDDYHIQPIQPSLVCKECKDGDKYLAEPIVQLYKVTK